MEILPPIYVESYFGLVAGLSGTVVKRWLCEHVCGGADDVDRVSMLVRADEGFLVGGVGAGGVRVLVSAMVLVSLWSCPVVLKL